jgi:FkbM family methyltransferase
MAGSIVRNLKNPRRALKKVLFRAFGWPPLETRKDLFGKYQFKVDISKPIQRSMWLDDGYEAETQALIRKTLKPGMVVLDIGSHVGFYTILMAEAVGEGGRVYCFEAHKPNYDLLAENVRINRLDQVETRHVALSDKTGTVVLNLNPVNDGGHSLGDFTNNPDLAGWDRGGLKEVVPSTTLDGFVAANKVGKIGFIKIDVEGAETLVFAGASGVLSRPDAPSICCEVGDKAQEQFGKTERDVREQLYSYEYRSFFIGPELVEFGPETAVTDMQNIFFRKSL